MTKTREQCCVFLFVSECFRSHNTAKCVNAAKLRFGHEDSLSRSLRAGHQSRAARSFALLLARFVSVFSQRRNIATSLSASRRWLTRKRTLRSASNRWWGLQHGHERRHVLHARTQPRSPSPKPLPQKAPWRSTANITTPRGSVASVAVGGLFH